MYNLHRKKGVIRLVNTQRILLFGEKETLADSVSACIEKQQIEIVPASGMEELWKTKADAGGILIVWEELLALWQWNVWQEEDVVSAETQLQQRDKEGELTAFWSWFRQLCQSQEIPVIVYLSQWADSLEYECLKNGASECVCRRQKPKLQAYRIVRQVLGRVGRKLTISDSSNVVIDKERHILEIKGVSCCLSPREFVVFEALWDKNNALVGREELSELVWGIEGRRKQRNLDMIVRSLRKKLVPTHLEIVTVYGKGYYLWKNVSRD